MTPRLPALLAALALSFAARAVEPKFLGPPVKKPADAKAKEAPKEAAHAEPKPAADPPVLKVGEDAPVFSGVLHNPAEAGRDTVDLSAMVGADAEADGTKVVLLSFFATWCGPCKKELPLLAQLDQELRDKGLRVISVAVDKDEKAWPQIAALVKEHHVTWPVVKDRYNLIARRYLGEKTALPSVFLVGRDGLVKVVKQGYESDAATFLRAEVEKALR